MCKTTSVYLPTLLIPFYIKQTSDKEVLDAFNKILTKYPNSPRANYMKADVLMKMADEQKSNQILEEGITIYQKVLDQKDVPNELLIQAGKKLAEKQLFRGEFLWLFNGGYRESPKELQKIFVKHFFMCACTLFYYFHTF